jgi:hypothetical protein
VSPVAYTLLGLALSVLVVLFGYVLKLSADVSGIKATCKSRGENCKSVAELTLKVDRLVYRQELADSHAADGLHAPTHYERDGLVDRLLVGDLTEAELERVIALLADAKKNEKSGDKRYWAGQLLTRAETELTYRRRPDGQCA